MSMRASGLLAVAIAAVPLLLGGTGVAAADSVATTYAGTTAADAARVALHLPQAAGPLPASSVTGFVSAGGRLVADGIARSAPRAATGTAALASGDLVSAAGPLAALNRSVTATRAHPDAQTSIGELPSNPLASGSLGALSATVRGLSGTSSRAELADGRIGRLGDLLPAQLRSQVDQGIARGGDALRQALDAAQSTLGPVLDPLASADPSGAAATLQAELQRLGQQLPDLLDRIDAATVLTVHGLRASQRIAHGRGAAVTSTAATRLASLDVLGGLVRLTGFASSAVASANGVVGGAGATASSTVASVKVGDGLLGVSLSDTGTLTADVAGLLPPSVVHQVDAALGQVTAAVDQVLSQAGVSITPAATTRHAARDGRSADATASGLLVTLQPPGQAKPMLQVGICATQARATARVSRVLDERAELPHTGSGLGTGALAAASAALVGGALLRRRLGRAG